MKPAFTIVELLVYMVIIVTLLTVLGSILFSTLDAQLASQATSAVEADGRYLLTRLAYDIRRADSLTTPGTNGATTSSLSLVAGGQAVTYILSGSDLMLTTPSVSKKITSFGTTVDELTVTRLGNPTGLPTVRINLTLTNTNESRSWQITLGLRDQQ